MGRRMWITFALKSGAIVKVKLLTFTATRSDAEERILAWECTGDKRGALLHLDASQVDMITTRRARW